MLHNWHMEPIDMRHLEKRYINPSGNRQLGVNNYSSTEFPKRRKPSMAEVDELATEIGTEFSTLGEVYLYKWYCRLCYKLGTFAVREIFTRSLEGTQPAKLFSALAKEAERSWDSNER